jgi:hypothetical protein
MGMSTQKQGLTADSSAALRNDKQKTTGNGKGKNNCDPFGGRPFAKRTNDFA